MSRKRFHPEKSNPGTVLSRSGKLREVGHHVFLQRSGMLPSVERFAFTMRRKTRVQAASRSVYYTYIKQ